MHFFQLNSFIKRGGLEFSWILSGMNHSVTAMLIGLQHRGQEIFTSDGKNLKTPSGSGSNYRLFTPEFRCSGLVAV
jgi:glutamine phosphoribosylpyrophosphate amidotransferase